MFKAQVIGNLGRDPEMRYTPDGSRVTSFSVASNFKSGEKETTTWINVSCWNKLAETANQYLKKGQQVFVEGRLQFREWDQDGVTHCSHELIASSLEFLGGHNEGHNGPVNVDANVSTMVDNEPNQPTMAGTPAATPATGH